MRDINNSMLDFEVSKEFFAPNKSNNIKSNFNNYKKVEQSSNKDFSNYLKKVKSIMEKANDKTSKTKMEKKPIRDEKVKKLNKNLEKEFEELSILLENILLALTNLEVEVDEEEIQSLDIFSKKLSGILNSKINEEFIENQLFKDDILLESGQFLEGISSELSKLKEIINNLGKKLRVDNKLNNTGKNNMNFLGEQVVPGREGKASIFKSYDSRVEEIDNVVDEVDFNEKEVSKNLSSADEIKCKIKKALDKVVELEEAIDEKNAVLDGEEEVVILDENIEKEEFSFNEFKEKPMLIKSNQEIIFKNDIQSLEDKSADISRDKFIKQIVDKAKLMLDDNRTEIRIKLKPEVLGELALRIEVNKGEVVAKAIVDNYRVKELIETNIYQLKEGLEEQGLDIRTFEVQVGSNSDFEKDKGHERFNNNRNKKIKFKKDNISTLDSYEENVISEDSSVIGRSRLDLKA